MTQLQTTTIGPETLLQGTLTFEGNAIVLGKVDGKLTGSGEVTIGQHSCCQATIEATKVTVDGLVEGNIIAKESVQLNSSARVTGDIFAQSISIATGATFLGKVRIASTTTNSEIETKSTATEVSGQSLAEPVATATSSSSTWATAKPTGLGAGLSNLGSSRAAWPNQR